MRKQADNHTSMEMELMTKTHSGCARTFQSEEKTTDMVELLN